MNVWNKVLYVLIAILCVGFSVLAANKYKLAKDWDAKIDAQIAQIDNLKQEVAALQIAIDGDPLKKAETWADLGVRAQLDRVRGLLRGDAFVNCRPVDATEVEIDKDPIAQTPIMGSKITFTVPASYSLTAFSDAGDATATFRQGAFAYVFDSGLAYVDETAENAEVAADAETEADPEVAAAEPRYLGAFKFVGAANSQAVLESVDNLTAEELAAIQESRSSGRSWIVCLDRLPTDAPTNVAELIAADAETFASLDETAQTFFETANPATQVFENLATAADATTAVDYQGLLARQFATRDAENLLKARRSLALNDLIFVLVDQLVAIGGEVDEATQALYSAKDYDAAIARKRAASYEEKQASLAAALAKMEGYRDLAKSKLEEAQARVAECQAAVDATLAENARLAAEIAQAQIALAKNAEEKSQNGGEPTTAFALSGI